MNTYVEPASENPGTVTGGGIFAEGETAELVAYEGTGWLFDRWEIDHDTDDPGNPIETIDDVRTVNILMDANKAARAVAPPWPTSIM